MDFSSSFLVFLALVFFTVLAGSAILASAAVGLGLLFLVRFGLGAGLPAGQKIGKQINIDSESAKDQKSVSDKLKEIKSLYDDGLITKKQFETKQKELLDEL